MAPIDWKQICYWSTHQCASNNTGLKILSWNIKITSFAKFHVTRPIWVRDVINDSEISDLLCVFKITQRIQNYSTYSELLHVFRITPRIQNYSAYSLFTRASRKASPERLTFRPPVGVLSAYHALILVFQKFQMALNVLRTCFLTILHRLRAIAEKFFFECLLVRSLVRSLVRPYTPYLSGTLLNLVRSS